MICRVDLGDTVLNMGAIKDLWQSERGLVAIVLIAACTVMAGLSRLGIDQWLDYTKWIFLTYAAAKTVTGTATILKPPPVDQPTTPPVTS